MPLSAVRTRRIAPSAASAAAVEALLVDECEGNSARVLLPCPEAHVVVRFGAWVEGGVDVAAIGARPRVHRKLVRGRQRVVMARLRLGASEAVLGVPARELAGKVVTLSELWGASATDRLLARLADTRDAGAAAELVDAAIASRLSPAHAPASSGRLVLGAAEKLAQAKVSAVAAELGVSERNLRRVFQHQVGMTPKAFAKIARFRRALLASRADASWASIAANAGYYDQAHLIAEFRALAGAKPSELLSELAGEPR